MIQQHYSEVVSAELLKGNIDNNEFDGFLQDYRVLHCLLKTYNPKSVFEIGTNMGTGTNIICNALPDAQVYSLDLPTELAHKSLQHPISEGKGDLVGSRCTFPYKQFRGDSLHFGYQDYPCEAYYVDGQHETVNVYHEACSAMEQGAKLIVFHDSDVPEVMKGIQDAVYNWWDDYELYVVVGTRIAYAVRKEESNG